MAWYLFLNVSAASELYTYCHTLSLHVALPISAGRRPGNRFCKESKVLARIPTSASVGTDRAGPLLYLADSRQIMKAERSDQRALIRAKEDRKSTRLNSSH